jgi:SAM-dependent methyltransferase
MAASHRTRAFLQRKANRIVAITSIDNAILKLLRSTGVAPPGTSLLELGEAEWYGAEPLVLLSDSIEELIPAESERDRLQQRLTDIAAANSPTRKWDLAKLVYEVFFGCTRVVSIDFHGSAAARRLDLNYPVDLGERFDVVFNSGTAEHVFDVCQFYRTVHEVTRPGGIMYHASPFRGWLEHGFYNFNPGFFWDLAGANGYSVILLSYAESETGAIHPLTDRKHIVRLDREKSLVREAMLYVVLRKAEAESDFRVPMQGAYAAAMSPGGR